MPTGDLVQVRELVGRYVAGLAATSTSNVVMLVYGPVIPAPAGARSQSQDHLLRGQQFQVSVHRSDADPGQPSSDALVEVRCGRMFTGLSQFLQDHLPLPRISPCLLGCHFWFLINNRYYYHLGFVSTPFSDNLKKKACSPGAETYHLDRLGLTEDTAAPELSEVDFSCQSQAWRDKMPLVRGSTPSPWKCLMASYDMLGQLSETHSSSFPDGGPWRY